MEQKVFIQLLDSFVADARIRFIVEGENFIVGGRCQLQDECDIVIRVHRRRFFSRVLRYRNLGMGEAFMDKDFEVEYGTLHDFLTILLRNRLDEKIRSNFHLALKVLGIRIVNIMHGKQRNVQSHYDIGDDLFEAFLDSSLTYSCGYAKTPDDDLEQLQANKYDRICRKLKLQPGDRLLDIGCGFGGLLIHAAKSYGITGVGATISRRHCERGNAHIAREGLTNQIRIEFSDFHALKGQFDKVVSVGMMEHVPHAQYKQYFKTTARLLHPQGIGLLHTVGCNWYKNEHDPYIQKYIFPAGNQPRLSEITGFLEGNRLAILDVENIIRHYGYTLRCWLKRFQENKSTLDSTKYNDVFKRMWEYYLSCCIAAASASNSAVYQVLFTKDYTADMPLQRV
jgi:cyclopropane-fatty-acyl-phospholipid synthase